MNTTKNAAQVNSASLSTVSDGLYPVYVKDGVMYPVYLTSDQSAMFDLASRALGKVYSVEDQPIGKATQITAQQRTVQRLPVVDLDSDVQARAKDIDARVSIALKTIGVPPHIKGYRYLREAIIRVYNDRNTMDALTKGLYQALATEFDTTVSKVERAIRHGIELTWEAKNDKAIHHYFGRTVQELEKPSNGEFIATMSDVLRIESL